MQIGLNRLNSLIVSCVKIQIMLNRLIMFNWTLLKAITISSLIASNHVIRLINKLLYWPRTTTQIVIRQFCDHNQIMFDYTVFN